MNQIITLFLFLISISVTAQSSEFLKSFVHFEESRGDTQEGYILTLPYEETVQLHRSLNATSGLGPTFNYFGTVVVVDQMEVLPSGRMQLIIRREDGRNFYGYTPTLKAILTPDEGTEDSAIQGEQ
ncbi:MAG: hypothetical protein AAGF77_09995 [Bacteroidota bacterium]